MEPRWRGPVGSEKEDGPPPLRGGPVSQKIENWTDPTRTSSQVWYCRVEICPNSWLCNVLVFAQIKLCTEQIFKHLVV